MRVTDVTSRTRSHDLICVINVPAIYINHAHYINDDFI